MSEPASPSISPRIWIAVLGVLGSAAVAGMTLLLGILALSGMLISYGGWKSGVDTRLNSQDARIAAVETSSKEGMSKQAADTKEQIVAVTQACKEMVTTATDGLRKSIEEVQHDRKERIERADTWRHDVDLANVKRDEALAALAKAQTLQADASARRAAR